MIVSYLRSAKAGVEKQRPTLDGGHEIGGKRGPLTALMVREAQGRRLVAIGRVFRPDQCQGASEN
jgi:hypothetical protein